MSKLHYWVENGGDGSACVRFTPTQSEAVKADESQSEGWGESSAGSVKLRIQYNKGREAFIEYREYDLATRQFVWNPVEES